MQREAEKEKRRAARRREREQLGFDVDRIVKIEDASIFEKLNMQHEFQGHQADRLEIIRNIKKEEKFKREFGKDSVINVRGQVGKKKILDRVSAIDKKKKQMLMYMK